MEFLIWMAIGVSLMAVELVSTRRYFRSYRLLRIPVGRIYRSSWWYRYGSIVCRARY